MCYNTVTFLLQDCLLDFLMLMKDPDRHVRKAAVVALSAVVHHKPGLVAAGLEQLLPLLYDQTAIKPEMVRGETTVSVVCQLLPVHLKSVISSSCCWFVGFYAAPGLPCALHSFSLPLPHPVKLWSNMQIRTVDLGPFKHRIDDGLELRKAAFECLDILLTALPHVLQQQPDFLAALESGLKDHQDVKAPAHLMLVKLAASPGGVG